MTNIRARQPYARRPAPQDQLKPFLDTELANIQRGVPVPLVRAVFADDTVQASDDTIEVDATAGPITITLPPPDRLQFLCVTVYRTDTSSNGVAVSGLTGGTSSVALRYAGDFLIVQSDGTSWLVRSRAQDAFIDVTQLGARGDGVTDDTDAVRRAFAATQGDSAVSKCVFFPSGSYLMTGGVPEMIGNDGFHGLAILGAGAGASRIIKGFDGVLFTLTALLRLSVQDIWFDGIDNTRTGEVFSLSGACNFPKFHNVNFTEITATHVKMGADCGYNGQFHTNHFTSAAVRLAYAYHVAGPDIGATERNFTGVVSNLAMKFEGALDTTLNGCFATFYDFDNHCSIAHVNGCNWNDSLGDIAGTPIHVAGVNIMIMGGRLGNSLILDLGSSGSLVGMVPTAAGIVVTDNSSAGSWTILYHPAGASYQRFGKKLISDNINGNGTAGEIDWTLLSGKGDADITFTPDADASVFLVNVPYTTNHILTLNAPGVSPSGATRNGPSLWIARYGGDTGGPWTLALGATGKTLANDQWCRIAYDGSAFVVIGKGLLT